LLAVLSDDYEVIIVDDGSTDGTSAIADDLARDSPFVSVVHHAKNTGYGSALRSGFARASKELIFYTDGDGQYDTGDLPKLLERMTDDVDVVNGFKLKRADTATRRVLGAVYNQFAHLLFRLQARARLAAPGRQAPAAARTRPQAGPAPSAPQTGRRPPA